MAKVTLNKDGTPRKKGSGRRKGAVSLISVRLSDLKKVFNDDDLIVCGRLFVQEAGLDKIKPKVRAPLSEDVKSGITLHQP